MEISDIGNEFLIFLLSLITIITILGNGLVIISILSQKSTRNVLHYRYILSLAIADLCIGAFVTGPSMAKIHKGNIWPGGAALCKTWIIFDVLFSTASIYSVLFLGFDRLAAVHRPVKYAMKKNIRSVNLMIAFAWTMGLAVSLAMLIETENFSNWSELLKPDQNGEVNCVSPLDVKSRGYVIYKLILEFLLPLLLLLITQGIILVILRKRHKTKLLSTKRQVKSAQEAAKNSTERKPSNKFLDPSMAVGRERTASNASTQSTLSTTTVTSEDGLLVLDQKDFNEFENKDESGILDKINNCDENNLSNLTRAERKLRKVEASQKKVTLMMGVVVGVFFICFMPFAGMTLVDSFSLVCTEWLKNHEGFVDVLYWIGYFNSFLNPLIYTYMNKNIRTGVINIFISIKNINICVGIVNIFTAIKLYIVRKSSYNDV